MNKLQRKVILNKWRVVATLWGIALLFCILLCTIDDYVCYLLLLMFA